MLSAIPYVAMLYLALVVLFVLLVIALVVGYELLRRDFRRLHRADTSAETVDRARRIQEQLDELKQQVVTVSQTSQQELERLWQQTDQSMTDRLDKAGDAVRQVRQSLGVIRDASQRMMQLGTQLSSLGESLRLPTDRAAGDGQVWLADLLAQMLPPQHYQLGVSLGTSDKKIDAVVRLGNQVIAIDAGCPVSAGAHNDLATLASLARFHVDRIAAECIRPDSGTVDFALMYLPAEGLYYDLIVRTSGRDSLSNYALSHRVIPVGPNTLYAYLYTIVLGLRGLQIEQEAEKIIARLSQVRDRFEQLQTSFRGLGEHLDDTTSRYDQTRRQIDRFAETFDDLIRRDGQEALAGNPLPPGAGLPIESLPVSVTAAPAEAALPAGQVEIESAALPADPAEAVELPPPTSLAPGEMPPTEIPAQSATPAPANLNVVSELFDHPVAPPSPSPGEPPQIAPSPEPPRPQPAGGPEGPRLNVPHHPRSPRRRR